MLDLSHGILGARSCGMSDIEASPENSFDLKVHVWFSTVRGSLGNTSLKRCQFGF